MKLTRILPILALSLALVACGGGSATSAPINQQPAAMEAAPAAPPQSASGGATALDQGNAPANAQAPGAQQDIQRLVIKTADLAAWLLAKHNIFVVGIVNDFIDGMRISPNVYSTVQEVDRLANAMVHAATKGID